MKDRDVKERDTLRYNLEERKEDEAKRDIVLYEATRTLIMKPTRKKSDSVMGKLFGKSKDTSKKLCKEVVKISVAFH